MTVAVAGPAEVLDQIVRWSDEDPEDQGYWRLNGDYSETVTTIARIRQGVVREARRVATESRSRSTWPRANAAETSRGNRR